MASVWEITDCKERLTKTTVPGANPSGLALDKYMFRLNLTVMTEPLLVSPRLVYVERVIGIPEI